MTTEDILVRISDWTIREFAQAGPNLEHVRLIWANDMATNGVVGFFMNCPKLVSMALASSNWEYMMRPLVALRLIEHPSQVLRFVELWGYDFSDEVRPLLPTLTGRMPQCEMVHWEQSMLRVLRGIKHVGSEKISAEYSGL